MLKDAGPHLRTSCVRSGDRFIGEAGTFDPSGRNVVTMQAMVAKNPAAMTTGATSVFTYQRTGDTLTLTQVRTP